MLNLLLKHIRFFVTNLHPTRPRTPFGLGSRGFIILNNEPEDNEMSSNFPVKIIVYDGVLAIWDNGKFVYMNDSNGLEKWLLERVIEYSKKQELGLEYILPKQQQIQ